jgi:hypothetical protein
MEVVISFTIWPLYPIGKNTYWMGDWADPRPGLYDVNRKIPAHARISSLVVQGVDSHFTNRTALAHHYAFYFNLFMLL